MKNYNFNPLLEKLRENRSAGNGKYDFFGSINNIKIFYRYFYPNDVDLSIPYVAPINNAYEDKRLYKFMKNL